MTDATKQGEIRQATQVLLGILEGITCDYELTEDEIGGVRAWLDAHGDMVNSQPLKSTVDVLERLLSESFVEKGERDDLIEECRQLVETDSPLHVALQEAAGRLHGFIEGILLDGHLSDTEIFDLREWLESYHRFRDVWPFDEVWDSLERVLADGVITEEERAQLTRLFESYVNATTVPLEKESVPRNLNISSRELVNVPTLEELIEVNPQVEFEGKRFCFTGFFAIGKRTLVMEMAEDCGAEIRTSVTKDLDYLVIGAMTSPCWVYGAQGKKIERVLENRKGNSPTLIIREQDFLEATSQ